MTYLWHVCLLRYGTPEHDCYSVEPVTNLVYPALITAANDDLRSLSFETRLFEPSDFMLHAAQLIVERLGGTGKFSTVSRSCLLAACTHYRTQSVAFSSSSRRLSLLLVRGSHCLAASRKRQRRNTLLLLS